MSSVIQDFSNFARLDTENIFADRLQVTDALDANSGDVYLGNQSQQVFHSNDAFVRWGNYDGSINAFYVDTGDTGASFFGHFGAAVSANFNANDGIVKLGDVAGAGGGTHLTVDDNEAQIIAAAHLFSAGDTEVSGNGSTITIDDDNKTVTIHLPESGKLKIENLPIEAGGSGEIWNDGGVLSVA